MLKPVLSFSHAGIFVTDLDVMVAFYRDVLGLTVTDRGMLEGSEIVFMSAHPAEHHEIVLASGRPSEARFTTVNQLSFRLPDLAALRTMLDVLRAGNVAPLAPTSHGTALSIYFYDPEGNRIELFIDTPWHVEQPMRIPLDLDRTEDEIWREVEAQVRELPGYLPAADRHEQMVSRMSER